MMTKQIRQYLIFLGPFLIILLISVFVDRSMADMYKRVDENGITHFSDTPPDATGDSDVETLPTYTTPENYGDQQDNASTENDNRSNRLNPRESIQKQSREIHPKVELYITSWCPWCKKAKAFFRSKGIEFIEYDIEKDKEAARRKAQIDRQNGVPFAVINGKGIHGYNIKAYNDALARQYDW